MQLFPCPFCGPREEAEFHYGGEAGNPRPEGTDVRTGEWTDYLHLRTNPKGTTAEVWVHLTCREFFVMTRNSVTHEILDSSPLHADHAQ
ncbi:sarcosine oxidase subunit delta [Mesorhizobium sp.]|uniref:sarcosine oxidase subunit delta n=1 Tax=Mesorhizobium sp. TaxID=1871066 RepID=UPI000FE7C1F7|nr:sarcosine oxidase subunit delta [Mesorhizobium sp.]RWO55337.1 MAG: sarcosine oxidase subunit delta [Mesorhizobium sp.]